MSLLPTSAAALDHETAAVGADELPRQKVASLGESPSLKPDWAHADLGHPVVAIEDVGALLLGHRSTGVSH